MINRKSISLSLFCLIAILLVPLFAVQAGPVYPDVILSRMDFARRVSPSAKVTPSTRAPWATARSIKAICARERVNCWYQPSQDASR